MTEQALSQELHRVADAAPVPADLFPAGLLDRTPSHHDTDPLRRRSGWVIAAAIAAALLVFLVTSPGSRLVSAAGELMMRVTVKRTKPDPNEGMPLHWPEQIGHSTDRVVNGIKEVMTRIDRKDWPADLPLPTFNPPAETAHFYRTEVSRGDTKEVLYTTWLVQWPDAADARRYFDLSYTRYARVRLDRSDGDIKLMVPEGVKVEQKEVTLKGQPATASGIGGSWSLSWYHESGGGTISGTVGLEELLKVAESMPELK